MTYVTFGDMIAYPPPSRVTICNYIIWRLKWKPSPAITSLICDKVWNVESKFFRMIVDSIVTKKVAQTRKYCSKILRKNVTWHFWKHPSHPYVSLWHCLEPLLPLGVTHYLNDPLWQPVETIELLQGGENKWHKWLSVSKVFSSIPFLRISKKIQHKFVAGQEQKINRKWFWKIRKKY